MNIQNIMAQAQKMQKDVAKKKAEIDGKEFIGNSEWVTVIMKGDKQLVSVKINRTDTLEIDDFEVLEDMITLAITDVIKKIDAEIKEKMGNYGSALDGLF